LALATTTRTAGDGTARDGEIVRALDPGIRRGSLGGS
jgi:hypothetical protein